MRPFKHFTSHFVSTWTLAEYLNPEVFPVPLQINQTSKHKYKSMKRIKELIPKIKEVSIGKNDQIHIIIKTHL